MIRALRLAVSASCVLLLTTCADAGGPDNGSGDGTVTGTWAGPLTLTVDGQTGTVPVQATLTQEGQSASGSLIFVGFSAEPSPVTGTVSGTTLTLEARPVQMASDDCHLFTVNYTFTVAATTLTLTNAQGQFCHGDGTGGHDELEQVTAGSGTLAKQ